MILIRWCNLPRKLQSDVGGEVGDLLEEGALSAASFLLVFEVLAHWLALDCSLVALKSVNLEPSFLNVNVYYKHLEVDFVFFTGRTLSYKISA
jgi:hypothetical protein